MTGDSEPTPTGPTMEHASYLGATDIAAVLGVHPYHSALDVWAEKVHGITPAENERMRIGKALERPVLEVLYAPPRNLSLWYPGTLRYPSEPWAGATPDSLAGKEGGVSDRIAECKIVGRRQFSRWGEPEQGADGLPVEVLVQVTWQLGILRGLGSLVDVADVASLQGTMLPVYGMEFDPEFFANLMEVGRAWWKRHVEGGRMPEVYTEDSRRVLAKIHPKPVEGMLEMRADVEILAEHWLMCDGAATTWTNWREAAAAKICALIGDAVGFEGDGLKVSWSPRRGSVSYKAIVDALGVSEAEREKYRGEPTRVFRITNHREESIQDE